MYIFFFRLSSGKVSVYNVRDLGSGLGRFPGEGNGNPLQYSCLENPMDGEAWCRLLSMGLQSQAQMSDFTFTFSIDYCKILYQPICFVEPTDLLVGKGGDFQLSPTG